tara:strand:- start:284 stop:733 length:450 start_codon:yes stop_codon:yes gene_type:complete
MAAVSSSYKDPNDSFVWWIEGDRIAIATSEGDGSTKETTEGKLKPVQIGSGNTITDGLVISYYAEPDKLTSITGTIDIDNSLQPGLIDYVKAKALMDAAASATEPTLAQIKMASAQQCMANYKECVRRYGMKKTDKVGGTRQVAPSDLR